MLELTCLFACGFHDVQIRGWGSASLVLCARILSEIKSLRSASFTGLQLEAPTSLCCSSDCNNVIGEVQDLATTVMHGMNPSAVVTCSDGHATCLQHFVGLVPDAKDGHAAELQYWLVVAETRARGNSQRAATLSPHIRTSLAASLVRWSASVWPGNGVDPSPCPRVWVGVRHHRDDTLLLRPVCEHIECLHAVRPFRHRDVGTWSRVQASLSAHGDDTTRHASESRLQVPIRDLMERSGRVLAFVSGGGDQDDGAELLDPTDALDGVKEVMTSVPEHATVSDSIVSSVHAGLRHPLRWVRVTAHGAGPSDDGNSLSKLWLCKHHAESTELKQLRRREQAMAAAMSRLAQWYWYDGHTSHAYGHACNTQLESAFQCGEARVTLHVAAADGVDTSNSVHTVRLRASPMSIIQSSAMVVRISGESCVACGWGCRVALDG